MRLPVAAPPAPGPAAEPPKGENANPFTPPVPGGAAQTVSQVLGEIVWLMSQSAIHKQMFIADLEWLVMTPILGRQFRLYYDSQKPIGVVFWAEVSAEVAARLAGGVRRLSPADWGSGRMVPEAERQLWVVEAIAPFGGAEVMVRELKEKVFPDRALHYTRVAPDGATVEVL
ncbi:MAG: toxin-activating lysine-acyltransferase [Hyphomicrobiaceae bacterium]